MEQKQKTAVSIIIPVYNAEKYLQDCMNCVGNQTLHEIEIIFVDDASTDSSLTMMMEFQNKYPDKVKVIHTDTNSGAGGARNRGMECAEGEYIGFVDSDDVIEPEMYEKLYKKAKEQDFDVVDCGYYKQDIDLAIIHTTDEMTGVLNACKRRELIGAGGYIVSKIFKADFLRQKEYRFRKNVTLEDADFLTYVYATADSIGNVKEVLYYYRENKNSFSRMQWDRYYRNISEAMKAICEKVKALENYSDIKEAVEYELVQLYSYGINVSIKNHLELSENESTSMEDPVIRNLKELRNLREKCIAGGYDNPYVRNKIGEMDIEIMKANDLNPENLVQGFDERKTANE